MIRLCYFGSRDHDRRKKNQGCKKLARVLINQGNSDDFRLCQFLQRVHQELK